MNKPDPATIENNNKYLLLFSAAALGMALRIFFLNKACYEIEQATWVYFAKQPLGTMFEWLRTEVTGILDIIIRHPLFLISDNPAFLKSYQVLLLIPVLWYILKLSELVFDDARPGIAASFMTAISPLCIHHAQLLRYHALAMFAVTGAVYYFTSYVVENKKRNLILFVVLYFIGAATHYYPIVLLPALFAGALAAGISGKLSLRRSFIACFLSGMSLILIFPIFASQYGRHVGSTADLSALTSYIFSGSLLNIPDAILQLSTGSHYPLHAHFALARILLLGTMIIYIGAFAAFASNVNLWLTGGKRTFFLIATLSTIVLPFFTVPFAGALYVAKYLVPFAPLFFLLLASLICNLRSTFLKYGLFALILFVFSTSTFHYYQVLGPRPDFRDAVHFIAKNTGPNDTVVITPGYYFFMFDAYGSVRAKLLSVPQGDFTKDKTRTKDIITPESMKTFASKYIANTDRIWVFYGDGSGLDTRIPIDPERASFLWFEKHYKPVRDYNFYISPLMPENKKPLGIVRLYEKKH